MFTTWTSDETLTLTASATGTGTLQYPVAVPGTSVQYCTDVLYAVSMVETKLGTKSITNKFHFPPYFSSQVYNLLYTNMGEI